MVRGYTIGWGKGIPDVYTQLLDGKQRFYVIERVGECVFLRLDFAWFWLRQIVI
jgi:hypothetical protein